MGIERFNQFFPLPEFVKRLKELVSTPQEIDNAAELVKGNVKITPYDISFADLTLTAGAGQIFMNNNPVSVSDNFLDSIRVKTPPGSTVTAYIYKVTGGSGSYSFELLHTYSSVVTTALEQTIVLNDGFIIPAGSYVALKSTGNWYFKSIPYASKKVGVATNQDVVLSFDFKTKIITESLSDKLATIDNRLELCETKKLHKSVLFKNSLTSINEVEAVNWTATAEGASPSVSAGTSYLWLKKRYHLENIIYQFDIKLKTDSTTVIEFASLSYPQGNGKFKINFATNTLEIYNDISGVETLVSSSAIPFTLLNDTIYRCEIYKVGGFTIGIKLFNPISTEYGETIYTITTYMSTENRMMDSIKFYQQSGTNFITISNLLITSIKNPLLMLIGDSILEGVYFGIENYNSRYGILLKNELNGDLIISARGGSDISEVLEKITTEVQFVKPEFVMLSIGTNNGVTETNLTAVVTAIEAHGSKVIINHVPNRADNSHIATNLVIDTVCKNTNAILGAKFDIATSIGGNPSNSYVVADYFDAGVHPSATGQMKMYSRFAIDCPYLFL